MSSKDLIYADPHESVAPFQFNDQVADVFPDMIKRSVPGYSNIVNMIGVMAGRYAVAGSQCYDLGCSLGAVTHAMHHQVKQSDCQFIGIDNSEAMIQRAKQLLSDESVDFRCEDVRDCQIKNATVVALNFTLQFIPKNERRQLIETIAGGMLPGGILVLSEKIAFDDPEADALQTSLHHAFKRGNGYSELEISQKRNALEEVLIPEPLQTHIDRLERAGFQKIHVWFQCFNFMSLVAFK